MTCLVDVFDVYDKVQKGFVDDSHLKSRISALRLGVMKTEQGKSVWNFMKINRSKEFIKWFEHEIYEKEIYSDPERDKKLEGMNIIRK
ncbi:hypothetical protein N9C24_00380 [Gammaproteobacteria bacterium]|nr:hypothetical protein [Gammaproteobacteria bacterium]MDA9147048.1 hypothetical protein [Gammaproteobacteria bacterium]MDA9932067.1 hypothetical protein [Gammaproteobacteria bacterium]MDC0439767.1 hypothetical protein [Gammaproteobacteria bacterium]